MKVLVLYVDHDPTNPKVFKDLPAFEGYLYKNKIHENYSPAEYTMMVSKLERGVGSWSDRETWIGWVEVQG